MGRCWPRVRLRNRRTKGIGSLAGCLAMAFKLCESVVREWRTLDEAELLPDVMAGTRFIDGEKAEKSVAWSRRHQRVVTIALLFYNERHKVRLIKDQMRRLLRQSRRYLTRTMRPN